MSQTAHIIRGTILLVIFLAFAGWAMIRLLKKSEDPGLLLFKWAMTALDLLILIKVVVPMVAAGGYGAAFGGIPFAAVCGLGLALLWRKNIAMMIAKPFGDLYDGGDDQIEPHPMYSVAQARRKQGKYTEAIAEIRRQLHQFPEDVEGQLLLAEIQAENLNDLQAAEIAIQRLCHQPGHPPRAIAFALNSMADWHLKYAQDREAARQALEKIGELFPESELAALAAQRIAHLASTEHLLGVHDRRQLILKPGVENVGLLAGEQQPKAPHDDPVKQIAEYVQHLQEHPLDTEARERLAVLYADHYGRLDLATDQLLQLISHPGQPAKRLVHWLNLLADLQIRHSGDYEIIRQTIQQIIDLSPDSAAASAARSRLEHLKLELKGKNRSQTVRLGTYEQDIGLKRGSTDQL